MEKSQKKTFPSEKPLVRVWVCATHRWGWGTHLSACSSSKKATYLHCENVTATRFFVRGPTRRAPCARNWPRALCVSASRTRDCRAYIPCSSLSARRDAAEERNREMEQRATTCTYNSSDQKYGSKEKHETAEYASLETS